MKQSSALGRIFWLAGLFFIFIANEAEAYSTASWQHARTDHFLFSFTETTEPLLERAARIAEETRESLLSYFGDEGEDRTISIVLSDETDEPNGGALIADPVVLIDCRKTQSLFRGETDWLRTVLTHELSHQYSLRLLKAPFLVNVVQSLSSNAENFSLATQSYHSPVELPKWFVEGMAQMGSYRVSADAHDPIRRMVLRDAFQNGLMLSLEEMNRFEGTSRDAELVYNQGFSFLIYLEGTYGPTFLAELCAAIRTKGFSAAFPAVLSTNLPDLYARWKQSLAQDSNQKSADGKRLFEKKGPMVMETSSNGDGTVVVANWENDYTRFGLFHKTSAGYTAWARDTGRSMKVDPAGAVWFTKLTYNANDGVSQYEVFRVRNGQISAMTEKSRVLAFDVNAGHLAYARYGPSGTEVVVRAPDGKQTVLGSAPKGTAVYSLVLLNPGMALVSLGTGPRVNLAILSNKQWKLFWPEAEVLDVAAAGEDRVVFSSTIDGTPQLYWADLVKDPTTWYRLTDAAGARFPAWDERNSRLTYSEYAQGGWHRSLLEAGLTEAQSTKISGPLFGTIPAVGTTPLTRPSADQPVAHSEPLTLGWIGERSSLNGDPTFALAVTGGWAGSLYSASGDWRLGVDLAALENLRTTAPPQLNFLLGWDFKIGPTRNSLSFEMTAESVPFHRYKIDNLTYLHRAARGVSRIQLDDTQTLAADANIRWSTDTTVPPDFTYFALGDGGVTWSWSDSPTSVFDPAGLGQSGLGAYFEGRAFQPIIVNSSYYNPKIILMGQAPTGWAAGGFGFSGLLFDSRLAVAIVNRGLVTAGAYKDNRFLPWALSSLGGSRSFSGYPADYATVVHLASTAVSLRTNPFVDKFDKTAWYERLNVGAKLEAGAGQFGVGSSYGVGIKEGYPLSAEVNFTASFYDAADHTSDLVLRFAMALNDFLAPNQGALNLPFQIYGSYLY